MGQGSASPSTGSRIPIPQRSRIEIPFRLEPEAAERERLAEALGIEALRKLRFEGVVTPDGDRDWRLDASLGATAVQSCVVTLAPVRTRVDIAVSRRYVADYVEPEDDEVEMPEDDTVEPLRPEIDIAEVMAEALALALPDYPRAEGAEIEQSVFSAPGVDPMTDEAAKPLAGLARLRARMDGEED